MQAVDIERLDVRNYNFQELMDILIDIDPDVSLAVWNILRMANSGWTIEVRTPDNSKEDKEGKKIVDEIAARLNPLAGGLDGILNQLHLSAYIQGAVAGEVAFTGDWKDIEDFYPVQPWTIYFHPLANGRNEMYQKVPMDTDPMGTKLNPNTCFYIPFDPAIDDPYGRAPASAVLSVIFFDIQLLVDLKRAVHSNAWGRIDVKVLEEVLINAAPPQVKFDPKKRAEYISARMDEIEAIYNDLAADDTLIHLDSVEVGSIDSSGKTLQIDPIIRGIERRVTRGLKMLPILMGSNEGTTETHGSIQWDIMVTGIQSLQKITRDLMEKILTMALNVRGKKGIVIFRYDSIRRTDRLKEAQATAIEIANAKAMRDENWISQDESAIKLTGTPALGPAPEPKPAVGGDPNHDPNNPENAGKVDPTSLEDKGKGSAKKDQEQVKGATGDDEEDD
jgi:hypothetical protein